ncbi:MAG TPA: hypothetical protein VHO47_04610 [Candidatus Babeliales bacterium]|nr:hypothetical protein [Candidatus Babeliales bacterium]
MGKHRGIILKAHLPNVHKCVIFDRLIGKLDGTAPKGLQNLAPGFLISYYRTAQGPLYKLEEIELVVVPVSMSHETIFFLHHVLELCYYFMPHESSNESLFCLLEFLLHAADYITYSWFKKIFLLRFFISVGMYPEDEMLHTERIQELINGPIILQDHMLDSHTNQALTEWLRDCVALHPQRHLFKTLAIGSKYALLE